MSKKHQIIFFLISFVLMGVYTFWAKLSNPNTAEQIPKANAIYLQQRVFINGLCKTASKENINRLHLQQSWFYDANFQEIAGAFGNIAFTLYEKGKAGEDKIEAVYCIEQDVLKVQYYATKRKPISFDFDSNGFSIQYENRLKPKEQESIRVVSLDEKQMLLYFENQKREQRYYRK